MAGMIYLLLLGICYHGYNAVDSLDTTDNLSPLFGPPLTIGAFNIRVFGVTKAGKPDVMEQIVSILKTYDIVLVQEIRDSSGNAIVQLLSELNAAVPNSPYAMKLSQRLGRSSSKEQYAYFYRTDKVTVVAEYQYEDSTDMFERPPYIVRFFSPVTELSDFAIIGCHVKPDDAPNELKYLAHVHDVVKHMGNMENIILMGDFNADCSYMSDDELAQSMLSDDRFKWIIETGVDTTSTRTHCTYDRIILGGTALPQHIVEDSATTDKFDVTFGLTKEEAVAVSDHYPVKFQLVGKVDGAIGHSIHTGASYSIDTPLGTYPNTILYLLNGIANLGFTATGLSVAYGSDVAMVILKKEGVTDVVELLTDVHTHSDNLMREEMVELVRIYLEKHAFKGFPNIPGIPYDITSTNEVIITYDFLASKYSVTINKKLF